MTDEPLPRIDTELANDLLKELGCPERQTERDSLARWFREQLFSNWSAAGLSQKRSYGVPPANSEETPE